jgi:hypothetical protein
VADRLADAVVEPLLVSRFGGRRVHRAGAQGGGTVRPGGRGRGAPGRPRPSLHRPRPPHRAAGERGAAWRTVPTTCSLVRADTALYHAKEKGGAGSRCSTTRC